jgi:UDP-glucose 4-epimerase
VKVLVTGGYGFIAGHLLPALEADGHEASALVRRRLESRSLRARVVESDLAAALDFSVLPNVDAIVHLAQANVPFPAHARELYHVNTVSTLDLLEYARTIGVRSFILASSGSVYGFASHPFAEDDPLAGRDFYATTKISAERLVEGYREFFSTSIIRLFAPYGPGQTGRLVPRLVARVQEGAKVTLNDGGRPRMNPVYVSDVVTTILFLLRSRASHIVNVAGDEIVGIRELAELIGGLVGKEPVFEVGTGSAPGDLVGSNDRLHELLPDLRLVQLAGGLERAVRTVSTDRSAA